MEKQPKTLAEICAIKDIYSKGETVAVGNTRLLIIDLPTDNDELLNEIMDEYRDKLELNIIKMEFDAIERIGVDDQDGYRIFQYLINRGIEQLAQEARTRLTEKPMEIAGVLNRWND